MTINYFENKDFKMEKTLCSSFGYGVSKSLRAIFENEIVNYEVLNKKEVVYSGNDPKEAVDMYNSIKSKQKPFSHQYDYFETSDLEMEVTIASSFGKGSSKKIFATMDSSGLSFIVQEKNLTLYKGFDSNKAVDIFNKCK